MEATEPEMARKARGPWTFNRLLLTMAFFDLVLALLVSGGFSPAAFLVYGAFLIPGLVFIALLTWRPNPWIYLATGIAVSYLFILFLPFIIGGLANPASPYEFSGDVLGLVAVFWALPAGVLGFLARQERDRATRCAVGMADPAGFVCARRCLRRGGRNPRERDCV